MATDLEHIEFIKTIVRKHFPKKELKEIKTGGSSQVYGGAPTYYNCQIVFSKGDSVFLRREEPDLVKSNNYFGGTTSLEKEIAVMELLRANKGFTVPEFLGGSQWPNRYAFLSMIPGITWNEYLLKNKIEEEKKLDMFLATLKDYARRLAEVHKINFDEFGDIQKKGIVNGCDKFSERFLKYFSRHFHDSRVIPYFSGNELERIRKFVLDKANLFDDNSKPTLVVYDLHPGNIMVNPKTGMITGLFDFEVAQAAHISLESGTNEINHFGRLGNENKDFIRREFFNAYTDAGGKNYMNKTLDTLHVLNNMLSAVSFYYGRRDRIRDTWSGHLADIVMNIVKKGMYEEDDLFMGLMRRKITHVSKRQIKI